MRKGDSVNFNMGTTERFPSRCRMNGIAFVLMLREKWQIPNWNSSAPAALTNPRSIIVVHLCNCSNFNRPTRPFLLHCLQSQKNVHIYIIAAELLNHIAAIKRNSSNKKYILFVAIYFRLSSVVWSWFFFFCLYTVTIPWRKRIFLYYFLVWSCFRENPITLAYEQWISWLFIYENG